MKKIILIVLSISTLSFSSGFNMLSEMSKTDVNKEDKRLCSLYMEKAKEYKNTMRNDEYAKKTYETYQKNITKYCKR